MTKEFTHRDFGAAVNRLIAKENFSREEMSFLFNRILQDEETAMHQGAFLSALAAKGETAEEIAAVWESIYNADTVKVQPSVEGELMENSGTGMDAVKTFNISTAASIAAASDGIYLARHGARAITSKCGTVDILEAMGIDVDADPECTKKSIEQCNIGIFNGMNPLVHPKALGRILSQISFGTILNTAASLANPVSPTLGVRGVYSPDMVRPVAEIMAEIGYRRCLVIHGHQEDDSPGIDEAGTLGKTTYAELKENGKIEEGTFYPEDFNLKRAKASDIATSGDIESEALRLTALFQGKREGRDLDIVCLNTGLLLYTGGKVDTMEKGIEKAREIFSLGLPWQKVKDWALVQSNDTQKSEARLEYLEKRCS